jgi:hypothetical protein
MLWLQTMRLKGFFWVLGETILIDVELSFENQQARDETSHPPGTFILGVSPERGS